MNLLAITDELVHRLRGLRFAPPVEFIYNPLTYARPGWDEYVTRFGTSKREVILLGMNPGPFGMVQTGVPFGEVNLVRDWLGIRAAVDKPPREHPKRPVLGFACRRSEVSGARLWGWAKATFGTPGLFFARCFVANYCPLAFLEANGRNRTPDKLPIAEQESLFAACDFALRRTVEHFRPRYVIGVGAFAERRAKIALEGMDVTIARILHPSPASPKANRNWANAVAEELRILGVELP